jgi:hypothetical protein
MMALRYFAVFSFVAGIGLLVLGFLRSGDGQVAAGPEPTEFAATPTPTATPGLPESTSTATLPAAPTPTPAPYDGSLVRFLIPRFEVDSTVETIGLLPTNQLDVPKDPLNTGWYDLYAKPGFGGNAVFAAHVDYYPDIRGPFFNLKNVTLGDQVIVVMDNGAQYVYEVIRYKRYDASTIPMGDLIWPADKPAGEEWITLITCGGRFQELTPGGPGDYLDRDVVVARRIQ